jgi:hypothetical protein
MVPCQQPPERKQKEATISLVTDELNYFVYSWYFPAGQWEFYLDYYVNIDKHGRFKLMLRDSAHNPTYFTGPVSDTIVKLVDKTFRVDTFKTDYRNDSVEGIAYSGYTYCFDYKTAETKPGKRLLFIQSRSPELLRILSQQLDNVSSNTKATKVDTLDITSSIEEFKKFSATTLGEPPTIDKAKFKPKRIKP